MSRIAVIAALPGELHPLVRGWERETRSGTRLWRRRRGESEWIAACAGAGAEAALRALAEIEKSGSVDTIVSAGWAGALSPEFIPGLAYCAAGVIDARTGERFSCAGAGGCRLATVPAVADEAEKKRLAARFGAGLADMEAAGLARAAAHRGVPFHAVKAVSDGVADRLPDFNRFISASGRFQTGRFALHALLRPAHWPVLLRLAGNSREGARNLRAPLLEILGTSG